LSDPKGAHVADGPAATGGELDIIRPAAHTAPFPMGVLCRIESDVENADEIDQYAVAGRKP
jgi:hypothetical protein